MAEVIHTQELAEGVLTVFDNGDCAVDDHRRAVSTYYPAGQAPYPVRLLVERLVASHRAAVEVEAGRGTRDRAVAGVGRRTREDELGVPPQLRSTTSLFRGDQRMARDPEGETTLRRRLALALSLGRQMARMHARLDWLIAQGGPRFVRLVMGDYTHTPGAPVTVPSELQRAIDAGLIVEAPGGRLALADIRRGLHNDIVDLLADELPGFGTQYALAYEQESTRITDELLDRVVLSVVDLLTLLVPLAGPAVATSRRLMSTAAERLSLGRGAALADDVLRGEVIAARDVPAGAIDATRRGTALARRPPEPPPRPGRALPEPEPVGEPAARLAPPRGPGRLPPPEPSSTDLVLSVDYAGPAIARSQETLVREAFGPERLRNLLAGFRLLDESLPQAIRRVVSRTFAGRGRPPAAADARLAELREQLRRIVPFDEPPGPTAALTAEQRSQAIAVLREARIVARDRWNTLRGRLWRELYQDADVRTTLRMMERDGLVRLPRGLPDAAGPPAALARNRDGIVWARTAEGATPEQIGQELGLSADRIRQDLGRIRAAMARGGPSPPLEVALPLNLDHITPVQLNPFRFFDPNNLRVLNASYNDTFLRLYQLRSPFPMTDDALEAWIRAFGLQ